ALSRRSYASNGSLVLEIDDAFFPPCSGRFAIEDGRAARTTAAADLALDAASLGSVYLGGFTFADLARRGSVMELVPGAIRRADEMFRTDRAPYCPEQF